jgi:NADH-quinone oxidoreductase subunit G
MAQRLRQAVKQGAQLNLINPVDDDLLCKVANRAIVGPAAMAQMLAQVVKAAAESKGTEIPGGAGEALSAVQVTDTARAIAESLINSKPGGIFLGNLAQHHPKYADIHALAQQLAQITETPFGVLGEAANSVGAYIAGAAPGGRKDAGTGDNTGEGALTGLDASRMLGLNGAEPCRAFILMNLEPDLDSYDPQQTRRVLSAAELVVLMSAYKSDAILQGDYADVLLPISPFTETSGTFISTEGRVQSFNGVVAPLGETRPAWKVLRVLGNMLQIDGFGYETPEQVRAEILPGGNDVTARLNNDLRSFLVENVTLAVEGTSIQRIGEVPIYQADPIVRRAESLQRTRDAAEPVAWMPAHLMDKLGIGPGQSVRLKQGEGEAHLAAVQDDKLPANCVRVASAHPLTAALGGMFGEITVERL